MAGQKQSNQVIQAGTSRSEEFGKRSIAGTNEKATTAVAEAAKADIQSAYVMAMQNKRDDLQVRDSIIRACKNPYFAEACLYRKPIGKSFIEGLSIRFAEEYMRLAGNMRTTRKTIYDDHEVLIAFIGVIDLETNMGYSQEVKIEKKVERKSAYGRTVLGERVNSKGERVFIVEATEDEIKNKLGAETSKFIRDAALRLCPAYVKQEAEEIIRGTIGGKIKEDPEAAKRKLVDAFSELGITPEELKKYVGDLAILTPAQIQALRQDYTALKDGHTTWKDLVSAKKEVDTAEEKKAPVTANIEDLKQGNESAHTPVADPVDDVNIYQDIYMEIKGAKNKKELEDALRLMAKNFDKITAVQQKDLTNLSDKIAKEMK